MVDHAVGRQRIFSIGFPFPHDCVEEAPFESSRSLMDADIVILSPFLPLASEPEPWEYNEVGAALHHWKSELRDFLGRGKTVFVLLTDRQEAAGLANYDVLPLDLPEIVSKRGDEIRVARDLGFLTSYWREFGESSYYKAYFSGISEHTFLTTKTGDRSICLVLPCASGTVVILPTLKLDEKEFVEGCRSPWNWTDKTRAFGIRLATCLVEADKALRRGRDRTPVPDWAGGLEFLRKEESRLVAEIAKADLAISGMHRERESLERNLEGVVSLKGLLYEKGAALESVILKSLAILGFVAKRHVDSDSEFDAVFTSEEGRFLGEVEGRDGHAISVDKLGQLERNLQDDFKTGCHSDYAKGVLFGNAFRLAHPEERGAFFTERCITGAKRSGIALVRTPDLYQVASYLQSTEDPDFARVCRKAIKAARGEIVRFPPSPDSTS
jgi:hypothetical protein